jgi:hypothetical protein
MSPVWQAQLVAVEGHPGSAQHVVRGNAVGLHAVGGACAAEEGPTLHEHPSHPAAQLTVVGGGESVPQAAKTVTMAPRSAPMAGRAQRSAKACIFANPELAGPVKKLQHVGEQV